jgi:hypothetical protein
MLLIAQMYANNNGMNAELTPSAPIESKYDLQSTEMIQLGHIVSWIELISTIPGLFEIRFLTNNIVSQAAEHDSCERLYALRVDVESTFTPEQRAQLKGQNYEKVVSEFIDETQKNLPNNRLISCIISSFDFDQGKFTLQLTLQLEVHLD